MATSSTILEVKSQIINCNIYTCTQCIFLQILSNERSVNALYYFDCNFELAHLHIHEYSLIIHLLFQLFPIILTLDLKVVSNTGRQYINTSYK